MTVASLVAAPAGAPLLAIGGALLGAGLPAARADGAVAAIPVLAGAAVLGLTFVSDTPSHAFLGDPLALGAASLLALLGFTAALAISAACTGAASGFSTGTVGRAGRATNNRRLRLARAVPGLLAGLGLFSVRLADPALALLALIGALIVAGAAGGLSRGVDAARAALGRVLLGVAAPAIALAGLALAGAASPVTGGSLATGGRLVALAALALLAAGGPIDGPINNTLGGPTAAGGAGPTERTANGAAALLGPALLLAPSLAAFALLLRLRATLGSDAVALADPGLVGFGLLAIAFAAMRHRRLGPALLAGRVFLAVALLATGLGGDVGRSGGLLAACAAVGAAPALAFMAPRASSYGRIAAMAAAGLPPFGGYAALALTIEAAASRSWAALLALIAVLGPALLLVLRPDRAGDSPAPALLPVRLAGSIHLLALLALGLVPSHDVANGLAAAAELVGPPT